MILSKANLVNNILAEIKDNSTGNISPLDVRQNLLNIIDSVHRLTEGHDLKAKNFETLNTRSTRVGDRAIKNLDLYPNPSKDVFNISFTSEDVQDLRVRVLNVIGEELIVENLQQFVGEYTKKINLKDNSKGIYLLEIETKKGIINKKLMLQ